MFKYALLPKVKQCFYFQKRGKRYIRFTYSLTLSFNLHVQLTFAFVNTRDNLIFYISKLYFVAVTFAYKFDSVNETVD